MKNNIYNHIEVSPKVMLGKPVIKGTRIPVYLVLNLLANGYTAQKVVKAYPDLEKEDVIACLEYAAQFLKFQEEGSLSFGYDVKTVQCLKKLDNFLN